MRNHTWKSTSYVPLLHSHFVINIRWNMNTSNPYSASDLMYYHAVFPGNIVEIDTRKLPGAYLATFLDSASLPFAPSVVRCRSCKLELWKNNRGALLLKWCFRLECRFLTPSEVNKQRVIWWDFLLRTRILTVFFFLISEWLTFVGDLCVTMHLMCPWWMYWGIEVISLGFRAYVSV